MGEDFETPARTQAEWVQPSRRRCPARAAAFQKAASAHGATTTGEDDEHEDRRRHRGCAELRGSTTCLELRQRAPPIDHAGAR